MTNTTKIDNLLHRFLSRKPRTVTRTPKRRRRGAARFDKAYLGIVAYDVEAGEGPRRVQGERRRHAGLAKQQNATIRERNATEKRDKEIARLERALVAEEKTVRRGDEASSSCSRPVRRQPWRSEGARGGAKPWMKAGSATRR